MWADITAWIQSPGGARLLQAAIVPGVAILVAGLLAALLGRAAVRAATGRADREAASSAVAALVEAARAATDPDRPGSGRRRSERLRTEADVRMRLLPVRGSDRAADWAAAQTDALIAAGSTDLTVLRDALVAWVRAPRTAPKLFATVPGASIAAAPLRSGRPAPQDPVAAAVLDPAPAAPPAAAPDAALPAWRRTKAGERLEQERAERTSYPVFESDASADATAPARLRRVSPFERPVEEAEEAPSHPPARHAAADEEQAESSAAVPPARVPAWIDVYDDEAEVTANLNLRTPPPVSASTVRDRAPSNADIVPRP